jgi:hypothetical protein
MDHYVDRFIRDRRLAARQNLRTSLRFRICKSSGPEQLAEIENLSGSGVFFATKSPMSLGAAVDLRLEMPTEISGKETTEWRCTGHVVRVVQPTFPEQNLGVGVAFDFYEICRA